MDRMLYTAMSGAQRSLAAQDVASHNLANLSTTGFREMLTLSRAVDVQGEGLATRVSSQLTTAGASMAQGTIQTTDRSLDVALDGPGMLAVQGANGEELYTRNGALQIDADNGRWRADRTAAQRHRAYLRRWQRECALGGGCT